MKNFKIALNAIHKESAVPFRNAGTISRIPGIEKAGYLFRLLLGVPLVLFGSIREVDRAIVSGTTVSFGAARSSSASGWASRSFKEEPGFN